LNIQEFKQLTNRIKKLMIKDGGKGKRSNLTVINREGIALKFIRNNRITANNNIALECLIYAEEKDGRIMAPQGERLVFEELIKRNKLDLAVFGMEEYMLNAI
jgi:hypothetical protein